MSRITAIMNPASGGKWNRERIKQFVTDYFGLNSAPGEFKCTSQPGEAARFAQEAVRNGSTLVIAIGGDGTINEVASGLVGTSVPLGIIPVGSGNGLARTLRIPLRLEHACRVIREQRTFLMDVGQANSRYFFLVAGFGFDAVVGRKFDEYDHRGPLSYFYISVKEFLQYHPETVKISFDGKSVEINPFIAACANGQQYGNNACIAPQAKLDDGLLDLCIVHPLNVLNLLDAAPKLFNGKFDHFSGADFFKTSSILIERERPGIINIDGEPVVEQEQVQITLMPKKLHVIASKQNTCFSQ